MELITAILLAGPLGYLAPNRRLGLIFYLLVWAAVLPVQTLVVAHENRDDMNWAYPLVNAVVLAGGLGLNRLGAVVRERRRSRRRA
jgi:hypothetical protein